MYRNLGQFLEVLRQQGELIEVDVAVDPYLEMAEIHRRVIAAEGPALLFSRVRGKKFPVVTNLFGTRRRIALAFGSEPEKFIAAVASLPEELLPPSLGKLWQRRHFFRRAARVGWRTHKHAPVLSQQLAGADLTELPALTTWSDDGGPFLTLPLVHTQGPGKKPDNLGIYRVQIFSREEAGMHFQIGKGGGFHFHAAEQQNRALPTNIYLGGPPALMLAAIAPLPENVPEFLLASLCQGEKLAKGRVLGHPLDPLAEAEFALLGEVPAHVRRPEGPFGDHYGYYSLQHDYPVFRPKHIFHRPNPVFPATVVGKPKQEDFYLGDYLQELLSPLFPLVMPAVDDLWSYGETGYHSLSAACLKERYGREAMATVFRILGEGQLSLTKFLLGVDKQMDLRDFKTVLSYVLARVDWRKDLFIFSELSMDSLDYAGPRINHGSKGVLLGMGESRRSLPSALPTLTGHLARKVRCFSPGCLVVEVPAYAADPGCIPALLADPALAAWPLIIAVDDAEKACYSVTAFLWTCFTRFEPAADIYARSTTLQRHHLQYEGPVAIDARMKPWYPKELFCDPVTAQRVSQRWSEYFPCGKVTMGSSDGAHVGRPRS